VFFYRGNAVLKLYSLIDFVIFECTEALIHMIDLCAEARAILFL